MTLSLQGSIEFGEGPFAMDGLCEQREIATGPAARMLRRCSGALIRLPIARQFDNVIKRVLNSAGYLQLALVEDELHGATTA